MLQMTKSGNRISPPPEELPGDSKLPRGVEQREVKNGKSKPMALMENDEYSICEAVRNGDTLAIKSAYQKSLSQIAWHVDKAGGWWKRAKTSKDYAQDAWVILLTKLNTGFDCRQLPDRTFYAYIGRIAYYLFLVGERGFKRSQIYLDGLSLELHEDREFDADKNEILRSARLKWAMGQLSQDDRSILEMHYYGELNHEALAKAFAISNDAVRQRLTRARARLLEILKQMGINGTWI